MSLLTQSYFFINHEVLAMASSSYPDPSSTACSSTASPGTASISASASCRSRRTRTASWSVAWTTLPTTATSSSAQTGRTRPGNNTSTKRSRRTRSSLPKTTSRCPLVPCALWDKRSRWTQKSSLWSKPSGINVLYRRRRENILYISFLSPSANNDHLGRSSVIQNVLIVVCRYSVSGRWYGVLDCPASFLSVTPPPIFSSCHFALHTHHLRNIGTAGGGGCVLLFDNVPLQPRRFYLFRR